ncbi:MAG TPA: acetyl-CoA carboxylase biotin carboxylase subunit [Gemmatimonadota bacterium]|nr:acetyl-CoA carboxylase biotin carboxylase subunit [Gemmatimonadota bacterium]
MFRKVLIANRGEIALRVIRACRMLGLKTVAVHSEADADALHVRFADEAVCIGPAASAQSYLNIPRLIAAAEITGADAVHPGYGFLAENAEFAEICGESHLTFIGPTPEQIRQMGDKAVARGVMQEAGVSVVPGSVGLAEDARRALRTAEEIGFPVLVKAAAGGGGKGMRVARSAEDLERALPQAEHEAEAAFGDGRIYIEKFLERPRHVEIQILGDQHGRIVHLGERDCSAQRRHQKILEEAPSPAVDRQLRERMGEAALRGAERIGYVGAGTVEFLLAADGEFYFMEMNTRLQVEHPVTELVTGMDLVLQQIMVATGEPLLFGQEDVEIRGHAIECRINAEDPERGFLPSPGTVTSFHQPGGPGVRVDTAAYQSYRIPRHYDSLIAKLLTHGADREQAIARMRVALDEFIVEGVPTTIPLHRRLIELPAFVEGRIHTRFVEEWLAEAGSEPDGAPPGEPAPAGVAAPHAVS